MRLWHQRHTRNPCANDVAFFASLPPTQMAERRSFREHAADSSWVR